MSIIKDITRRLCGINSINEKIGNLQNRIASTGAWENFITLNAEKHLTSDDTIDQVSNFLDQDDQTIHWKDFGVEVDIEKEASKDTWHLPDTSRREGYYGQNHFNYWASGLRDYKILMKCAEKHGTTVRDYLDFGCASGRVIRHFASQTDNINIYGADINRLHIDWIIKNLPKKIKAFHSHSIPTLPLPDESLDLISAYSVFTHIETFDTTLIMEFYRILRKGGIAWITVHTEDTWNDIEEDWPLYKALRNHPRYLRMKKENLELDDRTIFRWHNNKSYTANVFYKKRYLEESWGRILEIAEFRRRFPGFQDVIILRKP